MKKPQRSGVLNRYDSAYAERVKENTAITSPKRIGKVDQIAWRRIQEAINQGSREIEQVAPKIIKDTTEEF